MSTLATSPLFSELSDDELSALDGLMTRDKFVDNQTIVWMGDPGDSLMVIESGQVAITCPDESGAEIRLATLGPGEFFGDQSVLDGGPRTASVRAVGDVTTRVLHRADLLPFLRTHAGAAVHMLMVLSRRLRAANLNVRGIGNLNDAADRRRSLWQVAADKISGVIATGAFIAFNLLFVAAWMGFNVYLKRRGSDGFDGDHFDLLGFVFGFESLLITLFVLINQNQQGDRDRLRADLDYQVNVKAHSELVKLHQKLDALEAAAGGKGG